MRGREKARQGHCSEHRYTWLVPELESVPRVSVPDHVFAQLREAILAGRYRPGERLPSQRALAADLHVNMASVREALGRLEQLRLVEVRHGEPTRVLDWRRSGGLEALAMRGDVEETLLVDLFEARRLLLAQAARLAAERRSDEQAASLHRLAAPSPMRRTTAQRCSPTGTSWRRLSKRAATSSSSS